MMSDIQLWSPASTMAFGLHIWDFPFPFPFLPCAVPQHLPPNLFHWGTLQSRMEWYEGTAGKRRGRESLVISTGVMLEPLPWMQLAQCCHKQTSQYESWWSIATSHNGCMQYLEFRSSVLLRSNRGELNGLFVGSPEVAAWSLKERGC